MTGPDGGPEGETARGRLAIDAEEVVPGDPVARCIQWTYRGSIDDAEVRLYGRSEGGSGLERYLDVRIDSGSGSDPSCEDFRPEEPVFTGTLADLRGRHGAWSDGHVLGVGVDGGDTRTLRMSVEVVDDNRAQGRDAEFWLVLEARS